MMHVQKGFAWWIAATALLVVADRFWPSSWWFEVYSAHVEDARAGTSPQMTVERYIHRPFLATWRVELEREVAPGVFEFVTKASGENSYTVESKLPDPLFMDWWTYPVTWDIAPGRYRIETCWTIQPDAVQPRRLCATSNTFTITP